MNRKRMRAIERQIARFNDDGGQGGPHGDPALRMRKNATASNHKQILSAEDLSHAEPTPPETGKDTSTYLQWTLLCMGVLAAFCWLMLA